MRLASFQSSFFSGFTRSKISLRASAAFILTVLSATSVNANDNFANCTADLANKAKEEGVSQTTIDTLFPSLVHQDRVIELDRSQPEFVQTFPGYFSKRVTQWRTDKGKEMYAKHKD